MVSSRLRTMNMTIRPATLADAVTIARFNALMAAETEQITLDQNRLLKGVEALLRDSTKGFYLVVEHDNVIVGQLMITYEWSDWRNGNLWWIQSVYVQPEFRRQGVFRRLFQHILDLACAQSNVPGLRLYMHAENTRARRTYETLGLVHTHYEVFELDLRGPLPR